MDPVMCLLKVRVVKNEYFTGFSGLGDKERVFARCVFVKQLTFRFVFLVIMSVHMWKIV